jgi:hypothetical protein
MAQNNKEGNTFFSWACRKFLALTGSLSAQSRQRPVPFVMQVGGSDLVRSAWHDLLGAQDALCDQPADAVAHDPKRRRAYRKLFPTNMRAA